MLSVLKTVGVTHPPRISTGNSAQVLRGDWLKVSGDIEAVMEQIKSEKPHGG